MRRSILKGAALLVAGALAMVPLLALGAGEAPAVGARNAMPPDVIKWGFLAAALVAGLAAIGAAIAVAFVGSAAMGAVAEKPETAGRALIFVGLAEGIAIYGLIIAIMILGRLP
jgi:V/A-type H+-transporting ATPase subunit K